MVGQRPEHVCSSHSPVFCPKTHPNLYRRLRSCSHRVCHFPRGASLPRSHTHLPRWFTGCAGIFEMELSAGFFGLGIDATCASNWPLFICCDNRGACGAVVRGSCVTALGRALSSALWSFASLSGRALWIGFLASGLNCADPASRTFPRVDRPVAVSGANLGPLATSRVCYRPWSPFWPPDFPPAHARTPSLPHGHAMTLN